MYTPDYWSIFKRTLRYWTYYIKDSNNITPLKLNPQINLLNVENQIDLLLLDDAECE